MGWRTGLGAAAVFLAACGSGSNQTTQATETTRGAETTRAAETSETTASTGPVEEAATVPGFLDFTAETVRGEQVVGADYAGQDLVLWFWAPW